MLYCTSLPFYSFLPVLSVHYEEYQYIIEGQLVVYQYNTISASLHTMMIIYREKSNSQMTSMGFTQACPNYNNSYNVTTCRGKKQQHPFVH